VCNPYLSQIERGLRKPSAEILQQIAKGLRISAETLYVRAGILDEAHGASDVTAAVLTDPTIGERHKRVLLDIYESFRAEHVGIASAAASKKAVTATRKSTAKKSTTKKSTAKKSTATKATAKKPTTKTSAATAARTTNSRRSS